MPRQWTLTREERTAVEAAQGQRPNVRRWYRLQAALVAVLSKREGCWTVDTQGVRCASTQFRPTGSAPGVRVHEN